MSTARRSSTLRGTGQLVRLDLRLDRIRIPVWTLAVAGLVLTSAASVINLYSTPEEIAAYVSLIDISRFVFSANSISVVPGFGVARPP